VPKLECAIWEFTLGCNLRCSHCGSVAGQPREHELRTEECFGLCEALAETGCRDLAIMGGEPLLRDDFPAVARCAKDLGLGLSIVSNGTVIDKHIGELRRLEPKVVGVSIDGLKENHERIRGPGTWDKTVASIRLLRDNNIQTTIITTVSKLNFKDLPALAALIKGKGVNWQIQTAMPFGSFQRELTLTREEFYATALFIAKERVRNRFEDMPVVGAHCYGYFSKVLPGCVWDGCTAGVSTVGITSDGGVVGCLSMGNDRYIEGNVREVHFKDIWTNPDAFAYTRRFKNEDLGENCRGCKHGLKCRGGCNSVSNAITGKFHNDPYCFHKIEKELIGL
jgi:radical SAM protein with 4Fe4S-binding SPASM domain